MKLNQELFFERDQNRIRFLSTNFITENQWNLIFHKLNYLHYGFPDIDTVKEYFDKGNWLNEDQSMAVLEVFGLYKIKYPYSENQIKEDNQKAIDYFGTTPLWKQGGYLLTNGSILDFSDGQGWERVLDHRDIKDIIDIKDDNNGRLAMIQFMNYGNIRMQQHGIDLALPPNELQKRVLGQHLKQMESFYVDISNVEGNVVQTFEYDIPYPGQILRDIENYFKSLEVGVDLEEELELI